MVALTTAVTFLCFISYFFGVMLLVLLPLISNDLYVDENSLLPGSAATTFDRMESTESARLFTSLQADLKDISASPFFFQSWVMSHLHDNTQQLHGTWQENVLQVTLSSSRGFGDEVLVIVTPIRLKSAIKKTSISLSIVLTLMRLLSEANWLSKDIIWLIPPSDEALSRWLQLYHSRASFSGRKGAILAALSLEGSASWQSSDVDRVQLRVQGVDGDKPNLDIVAVVSQILSSHGVQLSVHGDSQFTSWEHSWLVSLIGDVSESLSTVLAELSPKNFKKMTKNGFISASGALFTSIMDQVTGKQTGPHSFFRNFMIDSLSLHLLDNPSNALYTSFRLGRSLEGTIRSLSNLLERLHHSHTLFLLPTPFLFLPLPAFLVPLVLVCLPLPLGTYMAVVTALKSPNVSPELSPNTSLVSAVVLHMWGASVLAVFDNLAKSGFGWLMIWRLLIGWACGGLALLSLLGWMHKEGSWKLKKGFHMGIMAVAIVSVSWANYGVAVVVAIILVPMMAFVKPLFADSLQQRAYVMAAIASVVVALLLEKGDRLKSIVEWALGSWQLGSCVVPFSLLAVLPSVVLLVEVFFFG